MTRRRISTRERAAIFQAARGVCHICSGRITAGERWEVEHVIPLAQGGEDSGENLQPAHAKCHRAKTSRDAGDTARAKRREAAHTGAKRSSRPLPGGRNTPWKRKMNGTMERRK